MRDADRVLSRENRLLFAAQGRADFWFFLTGILGLGARLREQPHREMARQFQEFIEDPHKRYALFLWPRETYKSTVFTQGGTLWLLVRGPRERILISNSKRDNAESFLRWIKDQIEGNEFLRWVYGDLSTDRWFKDQIWVRGFDPNAKEPSAMVSSVESSVTSQHYTVIIGDDLVDEQWVGTEGRVLETIRYFQRLQPLLTRGGKMVLVGTRWAEWDLYQYLLDEFGDDPAWHVSVRAIEEPDPETGEPRSIFPDPEMGYPPERIAQLRRTMGFQFHAQYMNAPLSESTMRLPEPQVFADLKDVPPGGLAFITCDPATSERSSADESAIVVTVQAPDDTLWVVDACHGRWAPSRFLDELFAAFDAWRGFRPVAAVGIEASVAAQRLWLEMIRQECQRRRVHLPLRDLRTGNQADAKNTRIKELEPYLQDGKYLVKTDLVGLLEQIRSWPALRHDDVLDAAAYVIQLKRPGPWQVGRPRSALARWYHRARTKVGL